MQVFSLFFKLLKSNKWIIFMYFAIFLGVALGVSKAQSSGGSSTAEVMTETELTISIIDEDKKTLGDAMKAYFGNGNEIVEMEYDEDVIRDKLYWRDLDYVLIIPEGFEESLLDDSVEDMELKCMKVPGYFDASFFETDLNLYTSKLVALLKTGYSLEEAQEKLLALREDETKVEVANFINENQNDQTTLFLNYVPYLFITLAMNGIGLILLSFHSPLLKARMECGATTMKERMIGLIAGILLYGVLMYGVVIVATMILSKGRILTDVRFPYFLMNMLAMLLFSLSLGFFAGMVAKNANAINGMVNVFSLGLCFLGGVFVPIEFFGDEVLRVAKFFPTYWYSVTNASIGAMTEMTDKLAGEMFWQIGVVVGYALVMFALTIVILSGRRKKTA